MWSRRESIRVYRNDSSVQDVAACGARCVQHGPTCVAANWNEATRYCLLKNVSSATAAATKALRAWELHERDPADTAAASTPEVCMPATPAPAVQTHTVDFILPADCVTLELAYAELHQSIVAELLAQGVDLSTIERIDINCGSVHVRVLTTCAQNAQKIAAVLRSGLDVVVAGQAMRAVV